LTGGSDATSESATSGLAPRIVHLLPCLYLGGAEQYVRRLIRTMSADYRFALVAPDGPGTILFEPDGITRRPFRRLELDAQTGFSSVRRALAEEAAAAPIDIVHVHIESGLLWFAHNVLPDVPRIFTAHGIVGAATLKFWLTARIVNRWADLVCVVSEDDRRRFLRAGADPSKLRLAGGGVAAPATTPEGAAEMARRLGVERGRDIVVGVLARLEPEKGVDLLIRAVASLQGKLPRLRLLIAGAGGQEARLRRLADSLGAAQQVRFAGYVREVGDFLACLDIYAQPSRAEAFGLGVTEAMATGLPVVASRVGGLPEQVVDGETGLLVAPGDIYALAGAIATLTEDAALRFYMGRAGKARHAQYLSLEQFHRNMYKIYREAVALRGFTGGVTL